MFNYTLILPDDETFNLDTAGFCVDVAIPDGFAFPPIEHLTQQYYKIPGATLTGTKTNPRVVTLTGKAVGCDRAALHTIRAKLLDALRLNRTNDEPPLPSVLRYTVDGNSADLYVYYLADIFASIGDDDMAQTVGIKLVAYDPYWYSTVTNTQDLLLQHSLAYSRVVKRTNGEWSVPGGGITGGTGIVTNFARAINGDIIAGGSFTGTAGGLERIARWNGSAWSALGAGLNNTVNSIAVAPNGDICAGGLFTDISGGPGGTYNYIARWDGAAWNALGTGMNGEVKGLAFDNSGNLYAVGAFTTAGGGGANRVAMWNGTAWSALSTGLNGNGERIVRLPNGNMIIDGQFTTAGGTTVNYVTQWNGTAFSAMASGLSGGTQSPILVDNSGRIWIGRDGTYLYYWSGSAWVRYTTTSLLLYRSIVQTTDGKIFLFVSTSGVAVYATYELIGNSFVDANNSLGCTVTPAYSFLDGTDIWVGTGYHASNTMIASVPNSITTLGDVETFPTFYFVGSGLSYLYLVHNSESDKRMAFNIMLLAAELATLDLSPGVKTFESNWRGNLIPYSSVLPISDFATWALVPEPIAPLGVNTVQIYYLSVPTEQNDNNNQLSTYENITGVTWTLAGANYGRLYFSIIADGGGFYHVNIYQDAARTILLGHTASYNTNGAKAIVADGGSGLGGTVTVTARVAADVDIIVYFAVGMVEWRDRFLSADKAVQ